MFTTDRYNILFYLVLHLSF